MEEEILKALLMIISGLIIALFTTWLAFSKYDKSQQNNQIYHAKIKVFDKKVEAYTKLNNLLMSHTDSLITERNHFKNFSDWDKTIVNSDDVTKVWSIVQSMPRDIDDPMFPRDILDDLWISVFNPSNINPETLQNYYFSITNYLNIQRQNKRQLIEHELSNIELISNNALIINHVLKYIEICYQPPADEVNYDKRYQTLNEIHDLIVKLMKADLEKSMASIEFRLN